MKLCNRCNREKDLSEFYKAVSKPDGHFNQCIACVKEQHRGYYKRNRESLLLSTKHYQAKNPEKVKMRVKRYMERTKIEPKEKLCSICGEVKPSTEFHRGKHTKDGRKSECKNCMSIRMKKYYSNDVARHRAYRRKYKQDNSLADKFTRRKSWIKKRFGITVERFNEMLKDQGGCCQICGTSTPGGKGGFSY
jgi:hypothetical protein